MHNNKIMLSFANEFQTRLLSLDVKNNKIVTQKHDCLSKHSYAKQNKVRSNGEFEYAYRRCVGGTLFGR